MAVDQHVNFFALEKACEKPGCPMCTIINERIHNYIDDMLFEHISDRVFRAQYRAAGGFCKEHADVLLSYRDGLAVAIIGKDNLEDYIYDFKKKKMRKRKDVCPACAEKERIEKDFLTFIAESDSKDENDVRLQKFFTESDGLCVKHYAKMISLVRKVPKWVSSFQEAKYQSLYERVERFIDYSAWGKQEQFDSLSAEDKVVWKELAAILNGQSK